MPELIRTILEAATQAPSGENVQPWHFAVCDSEEITVDVRLSKESNQSLYGWGDRASYVAIGAAIENLCIMTAEHNWHATCELFPNPSDPQLVARLVVSEQKTSYGAGLAPYIVQRVTNRKPYDGTPLTPEDIAALSGSNQEIGHGEVRIIAGKDAIEELAEVGAGNELIMLNNEILHDFFFSHVNWTKEIDDEKKAGFFIDTLELPPPAKVGFKIMSSWRRAKILNKFLSFYRVAAMGNQKNYATSSAIGAIISAKESPEDAVSAGMLTQRVWLEATRRGLALQPLTGLLYCALRIKNGMTDGFSVSERKTVLSLEEKMRKQFSMSPGEVSYFMFRTGHAPPPTARASRFPIDAVSSYERA